MKKLGIGLAFAAGFVLLALLLTILVLSRKPLPAQDEFFSDSLFTPLPQDAKLAQKEIARVEKALAKLKPATPYIVIDTHANKFYWRTEDSVLFQATCSTGSGGELVDSLTGRRWVFNTPRGAFKVNSKLTDPWWRKPDWAFIEEGEEIPDDPSERYDPEMLGEYAMGFGDGYFIHGTLYKRLLGINVTHGCVRLGDEELRFVYDKIKIGTPVYIF
jgi:L,D-transpeptidase YbiS